jgi:hypothetical protein
MIEMPTPPGALSSLDSRRHAHALIGGELAARGVGFLSDCRGRGRLGVREVDSAQRR